MFKGSNHIWAWRQSLSCNIDFVEKIYFLLHMEASHDLSLVSICQEEIYIYSHYVCFKSQGRGRQQSAGNLFIFINDLSIFLISSNFPPVK